MKPQLACGFAGLLLLILEYVMPVMPAYLAVLLIWSTTPLAIKLSNESISSHAALATRMLLAFILAAVVISIFRGRSVLKLKNWRVYWFASLALFPNMSIVYLASTFLDSGIMAILFSLTPVCSGLLASIVLKEAGFERKTVIALCLSIVGLVFIFKQSNQLDSNAVTGIWLMLTSCLLFSMSQVSVKYLQRSEPVDALEQTFGALTFSLPGLIISWYAFDGKMPMDMTYISVAAIVYLAIIGSLVSFVAYYFILNKLSIAVVSTIPLIAPVLALWLGALLAGETVNPGTVVGTTCILLAVAIYDGHLMGWLASKVRLNLLRNH